MSHEKHYKDHLASFYSWMFGDFGAMVSRQRAFFEQRGLRPRGTRTALDLGCGSGFQSVALRQLGFRVLAVDTSAELIAELNEREPAVETQLGDLRHLGPFADLQPELVVCMGDTLTHLESREDVAALVEGIYRILGSGGRLVLTFRDLTTIRFDLDRFILNSAVEGAF